MKTASETRGYAPDPVRSNAVKPPTPAVTDGQRTGTIGYGDRPLPSEGIDVAATLAQNTAPDVTLPASTSRVATAVVPPAATVRTTVLPRVDWTGESPAMSVTPRKRFEKVRPLGAGGVGEVSLVHDFDIDRDVAVKRLHPEFNDAVSLMRFAEEVRAVGNLEHPNIAPVHDVGIDEEGQHFLMMKYVQGETLETVIERLAAHDPAYEARFGWDARVEIFRGVLRALHYAHSRGIIHRDIKPSNVMIGPFGEVVLMDWGLAKQIRTPNPAADVDRLVSATPERQPEGGGERAKLFRTRQGAIMGTPAYMSPEQARGDTAHIDERSDIYSACVLFHELLGLEHYLADKQTVTAVVTAVATYDLTLIDALNWATRAGVPAEYMHIVRHGLRNDPTERFQNVNEILDRLQESRDGLTRVECPVTLVKRVSGESIRFVDRHPFIALVGVYGGVAGILAGVVLSVIHLVH